MNFNRDLWVPPKGRIPSLDGLRAVSILMVICAHLIQKHYLPEGKGFEEFQFIGILGVRFFFVISGFLITFLLLKEKSQNGSINFKAFYVRRFLRIFPGFYLYISVLSIVNVVHHLQIERLQFLSALLYLQNMAPRGTNWFVAHSWSLAIEEQFYLIWPLIFLQLKKVKHCFIWGAGFVVCRIIVAHYNDAFALKFLLVPFFVHAVFLFSGCLLGFMYFFYYDELVKRTTRLRSFVVFGVIFLLLLFSKAESGHVSGGILLHMQGLIINASICFLVIYFVAQQKSVGYRFLNASSVTFVGKISYGLYLWQQLFVSGDHFWWSAFPQNIFLTFIVAFISFELVEKPFLRLKERYTLFPIKILARA